MENAKKKIKRIDTKKSLKVLAGVVIGVIAAIVLFFVIRGNKHCSSCYGYCNGSHSFNDGEVVLCGSCYKDWFKEKSEMDPADFFKD